MVEEPAVEGRSRRKAIIAGSLALVLVAIGSAVGLRVLREDGNDLPGKAPRVGLVAAPMTPESAISYGSGLYLVEPGKDVQILEVKMLRTANVEYLGAYTVWPGEGSNLASAGEFPAAVQTRRHDIGELIPSAKTSLRNPEGEPLRIRVTLGFRLKAGAGEYGAVNGITIVYKADGKRKKFHLPASVIMCFQPKKNCQDGRPKTDRLWENDLLRELGVLND